MRTILPRLGAGLIAVALVIVSCTESSDPELKSAPGPSVSASSPEVVPTPAPLEFEDTPTARIDVVVRGRTVVFNGRRSEPTEPGGKVTHFEWRSDPEHPADLTTAAGAPFKKASGPDLTLTAPANDGEYYVALEVTDGGGSDVAKTYFAVEEGTPRVVDHDNEHPRWIDTAVIYAPIPELWGNGGPRSVTKRLPYLKELGVDALWLWPPISERATGEQYAITDHFKLDPSWGPEPAFREMVDEAHRLGMKVLADVVPNHMSVESDYFKHAQAYGEESPWWDFFDRKPNGEFTHYFDWTHLPNLNFDNPKVRRMIDEAFAFWVGDLGLDGFRVDAAWAVKLRRPDYWMKWRRDLKRIEPDLMLIAEAPAVDPYYFKNGFDIGYDWSIEPGQWAWGSVFEFPREAAALLQGALTNGGKGHPDEAVVMRFLNNNDTGIRFVDQHGPELTRVAATMQFTVPGIPALFAGDEIGASYEPYSNLTPLPWRDRFNLRGFYDRLIALKHEQPALSAASRRMTLLTTDSSSAIAYLRPAGDDPNNALLVILNYGGKGKMTIEMTPEVQALLAGPLVDHLTGTPIALDVNGNRATLRYDALSSFVIGRV
ncbi:MAG: alpha-amylase family glycosyl hydrolase [Actinomycetota bacterium]